MAVRGVVVLVRVVVSWSALSVVLMMVVDCGKRAAGGGGGGCGGIKWFVDVG